jgi:hypothetical protein
MKTLPLVAAGLVAACLVFADTSAQAQFVGRPIVVPASAVYGVPAPYAPGYVGPWGRPYHGYHASTAAESFMRGAASLTRAHGAYNLMSSQAAINYQHATSQGLDNFKKNAETYFDVREINRAAREKERGPRPTQETLARLARQTAPGRLDAEQLDAATGSVAWPAALQGEQFAPYRAQIEKLLSEGAAEGGMGAAGRQQIKYTTGAMLVVLKSQIREMPPMEYSGAKRFLESLAYEAQRPNS